MLGCMTMSRATIVSLLLSSLALVACGAGDAHEPPSAPTSDGAATNDTSAASSAPGAGTYTVPVTEALEGFATFDVAEVRYRERDGELELTYDLPALLVGEPLRLSFQGSSTADDAGNVVLTGDSGVATCRTELELVRCDEELPGVALDADKLERELAPFAADERAARRAIAEQFSVDPIGILRFAP
jgi:hypothetical protein